MVFARIGFIMKHLFDLKVKLLLILKIRQINSFLLILVFNIGFRGVFPARLYYFFLLVHVSYYWVGKMKSIGYLSFGSYSMN